MTDEYKQNLRRMFDTVSEGYDNHPLRFFVDSAKHLPKYSRLKGDEHVLDIATGTGHSAIALSEALPDGRVTGIDFSDGMLANARSKIEQRGISNISLYPMDMQALEFRAGTFDAAVFAFSLFFVEDMEAQLLHAARKVRPGGRVLATSFSADSFRPLSDMFFGRLEKFGVEQPTELWRISTPEECSSLFEKAGLTDVRVDMENVGYYLANAGEWWEIVWNTAFRKFVGGLSPDNLERFREEHQGEVAALSTDNGIWLDVNVIYTQGIVKAGN